MPPTRRALGALAVVAVLIATAAAIGSRDGTSNRSSDTTAASADRASTSEEASSGGAKKSNSAPATTVAPGASTATGSASAGAGADPSKVPDGATRSPRDQLGAASVQAKIIRTGSVGVEVTRGGFSTAVAKLTDLASGVGGFVSASETSQFGDNPQGSVTLRVPAKDFDRVLDAIGDLGKVRSVTTGSQDVTGEYTDTAARIKALQDEREQISLVLSRAESIPDILSVRDRLSAVQGELEQLQGRKQVLDDQTSLSTVTVRVTEKGAKAKPLIQQDQERRGLAKVWHDSADRFGDGARAIAIGFAAMAPWLLLAAVLWLPVRWLWRRSQAVPTPVATSGPPPTTAAD